MTEISLDITTSSLHSEDLAPIPERKRRWTTWNYTALWVSMSLCIPTYMLASSLIQGGMNWWQAVLTIFLGKGNGLVCNGIGRCTGLPAGRQAGFLQEKID